MGTHLVVDAGGNHDPERPLDDVGVAVRTFCVSPEHFHHPEEGGPRLLPACFGCLSRVVSFEY